MYRETELYKHAARELDLLVELERQGNMDRPIEELEKEVEIFKGCTPQEYINKQILDIVAAINSPELTGFALSYIMETLQALTRFQNLTPLSLNDDEFEEVFREGDDILYQNKRNFSVFKSTKNGVYHLDGQSALNAVCGVEPEIEELVNE